MLREGSVSCKSAGWMPCTLAALLATGMIVSYIWSIAKEDVEAWMPYISEAGGMPPQSGIFALFLFFSASIGLMTMLARHAVMHQDTHRVDSRKLRWVNNGGLALGMLCLAGMLVVASYPVHTFKRMEVNQTFHEEDQEKWSSSVLLPHTIGAMFCFVVGLVYAIVQIILSLILKPPVMQGFWQGRHMQLFAVRVAFCVAAFAALVVMMTNKSTGDDPWQSAQATRVRAVAEWILALMLILLFFSLYPEMESVRLELRAQSPPCGKAPQTSESTSQIYPDLT